MTCSRSIPLLAGAVVAPVALAVGCGNGGEATASSAPSEPESGNAATVRVVRSGIGSVLANSQGRTVYLFKRDKGTPRACILWNASTWPPLRTSGRPTVGSGGAYASKIGATPRSDGNAQVTYNGHPLHLYRGDRRRGDTNGHGVKVLGGAWYALSPVGNRIAAKAAGGADRGY